MFSSDVLHEINQLVVIEETVESKQEIDRQCIASPKTDPFIHLTFVFRPLYPILNESQKIVVFTEYRIAL